MQTVLSPRKLRGFTLIEVLVVIAIIAILAAILFPVFAKAREKARQTTCLSNEKQIGLGLLQYTSDNEERFPGGANPTLNGTAWIGCIYTYVKSTGVFKCPDDATTVANPVNVGGNNLTMYPISYSINSDVVASLPGQGGVPALTAAGGSPVIAGALSKLTAPAITVLVYEINGAYAPIADPSEDDINGAGNTAYLSPIGEGYAYQRDGGTPQMVLTTGVLGGSGFSAAYPPTVSTTGGSTKAIYSANNGYHSDGSNYLLGDGHAKWLRGAAVSPGWAAVQPGDASVATVFSAGNPSAAGTSNMGPYAATFSPI